MEFKLVFFKPETSMNPDLEELYKLVKSAQEAYELESEL